MMYSYLLQFEEKKIQKKNTKTKFLKQQLSSKINH